MYGAGTKSRTRDLLITIQLLYRLSYTGKWARILMSAPGSVNCFFGKPLKIFTLCIKSGSNRAARRFIKLSQYRPTFYLKIEGCDEWWLHSGGRR